MHDRINKWSSIVYAVGDSNMKFVSETDETTAEENFFYFSENQIES